MKCPKCNAYNPDDSKFCKECGTNITSAEEAQPSITKTIETPREELTTGSTFAGRYQIIEELGRGGMGKVYRVLDKKLNEEVALKLIKPDIASDKNTIERFKNELKLARKIRQKNVGSMYELLEDQGIHFITMEYISGQDLKGLMQQTGKLTIGKAISIAKQICDGLSEAHSLGVVHRDLKPSNIMIDRSGNAKIMDFGIARAVKGKGITGAGVMIGTPEYMSPEQVEGKDIDQRSDIYSLGIVLYEITTGMLPFQADTHFAIGVMQRSETPKNPQEFNPQISDELRDIILKCLEKEPERRYQESIGIRADLELIEKGITTADKVVQKGKTDTTKAITTRLKSKRVVIPTLVLLTMIISVVTILRFVLPSSSAMDSIAVLPFDDLSPDKNQGHWAEGIPETLINALSKIDGLHIPGSTSSFSLKEEQDIKKIGDILGVDALLEGSIQVSGNNLRILVRLIRIENGFQVWSEQYQKPLDDIFTIQDEIAQTIVKALEVRFLSEKKGPLIKTSTKNSEAYNLYLQGLFHNRRQTESSFYQAIDCFERAIQIDTEFAQAYSGLADSLLGIADLAVSPAPDLMIRAETAVKSALELDYSLAEAHKTYGLILVYYRWDWEKAEQEFRHALLLNPGSAEVRLDYSIYLKIQGRNEEALDHIKLAVESDPLSLGGALAMCQALAMLGRLDVARNFVLDSIEKNPTAPLLHWRLGCINIEAGEYEKGIQALHQAIKLMEGENISDEIGLTAYAYASWGNIKQAEDELQILISYSEENYVSPTIFAIINGGLGNLDEAFRWLDQAYIQHDSRLIFLRWFWYESLRDDPRFGELMKKVGLEI